MAALSLKTTKTFAVGFGTIAASSALLLLGAGSANADDTDPALNEIGTSPGVVTSRQSAAVVGSDLCVVNTGTLSTASTIIPEQGVPTQKASESGPAWVGSDGWAVQGIPRTDSFVGTFHNSASTGPACSPVSAPGTSGRGLS